MRSGREAGILVTVPEDQADVAVRALADNMDAIADAARSRTEARRRRARETRGRQPKSQGLPAEGALTSERLRSAARPIVMLLVGLLVLSTVARVSPVLALVGVGVGVYLLGRRTQEGDGMGGMGGRCGEELLGRDRSAAGQAPLEERRLHLEQPRGHPRVRRHVGRARERQERERVTGGMQRLGQP
jgi:hypothetical protein